ncbi:hypothetical protein NQ314_007719 [Rhamnusium bicolor]|uniref:NADH dehydrogenase (Ubiquinone) complex I, assembly factor 6 n=1 Tax=Rhamnusium bicolor TaxID=1586634 RepID=A0AAV8YJV3_9CUCU|nr:hypothetical protein NQ314_007719 [Rhamnusium bicolor]
MNINKLSRKLLLSRNINILRVKSTSSKTESSAEYCLKSVKNHDYENFICTLLLQNRSRSGAFAIRSFNVEVARVAEQVSRDTIGLMRLQFWEDTIEKCFSKDIRVVPKHPVAIELYKANSTSKLTKRSIPHARRLNFLSVPQDILIKNKVSQEEVIRAKGSERLNECTFEIASRAHQHLVKARSLIESIPKEGRTALLPAVPIHIYLDRLQKCDYNVFHRSLQDRSWKLLPQLWFTNFKNKY